MEDQDYILFDSYISGELSAEETLDFENRLKSDVAFAKSFNVYEDATRFLKNTFGNNAETKAFKKNLEAISNTHFKKHRFYITSI